MLIFQTRLLRLTVGWFLGLLFAGLLASCGESTTNPTNAPGNANFPVPVNPKIAALPPTTLRVWFASDYYNETPIVDMMREFRQAYPNITIEVDHTEWGNMRSKVRDSVKAAAPPDVAHQHAFVFGAQGYAEPLDDLWKAWGQESRFMPGSLDDVSWNGIKYGVPLDINTLFLIYNRQMFQEVGLPEPGADYNYTRLLDDARKLTKSDGSRYALTIKPGAWDTFGLLRSNGGDLLEETSSRPQVTVSEAENLKMLEFLAQIVMKDKVSLLQSGSRALEPVELFKQGKIAMFFSGPWDLKKLEKESPALYETTGTATMPRGFDGKTAGSVQGGGSLFVPKGAKNREAAFEFMKWATSPKYQMRLTKEMGRYPVLTDLYKDPFFTGQPRLVPFLEQLKTARPYKLEAYAVADLTWEQTIASILSGGNPSRILSDAERAMQAAVNAS
jgi:ABC-type glycerol-3-phosphate transport system substrate-binding protein